MVLIKRATNSLGHGTDKESNKRIGHDTDKESNKQPRTWY